MKLQPSLASLAVPDGSVSFLRVTTHCSGSGARKYLLATSISLAKAAAMLAFCESVKAASVCLQTNLVALSTSLGLVIICRVAIVGYTSWMS